MLAARVTLMWMDRMTRAKVDSLVHLLRSCPKGELASVDDLARKLQLDPMIVRRIAEEQGIRVRDGDAAASAETDPNQNTQVMSLDEILGER
ncbi:MAG: hypothetical protein KUG77_06105 [Nannocystaceae bacterium]|nr:hypothetical protein [Nannocystaceae bacterium]